MNDPNIFINNGFIPSENGHIIRLADLLWLEVDDCGFATLKSKRKFANIRKMYDLITIPKPARTDQEIKDLLNALIDIKLETK